MLTKISKLNLSYLTKSCRHTLSPNEKIWSQIYFFVTLCDNGDRQREPCPRVEFIAKNHKFYMGLYSEIFRNLLVTNY